MKSIKTSLAGFLAMVLVFSGLFLTCDVGLGDSVDTKPPKVSVTSPAVDSVLAGAFSLQGTASDETALKGVSVMVTETTTGAAYGPYKANIDSSSKTWSVNINETDANGNYVIPDGMYQLTVTATDKANRTSVATTVYQIDNHLPTVLVTSPLSYGAAKTTFYRTIDINGEVYDGSTIQEVIVQIVGADGAALASAKADGTNTWFARFDYKASDTTLADNAVYGMNVLAKDMAGNVNTYYYHRSDIYPVLTVGSDGYVTFPSMNQIGKVDQGLSAETEQGLTKDELAALRHGKSNTAEYKYPDFVYRNVEPPKVQWLNVTDAKKTIGLGVPIVGTILPPTDGSPIVESSIQFSISSVLTPTVAIPQPATRVSLSNVASSYNFEVKPGNAANDNLGTGVYIIKVTYKTVGGLTLEATREFGIASGAPTLTETGVAGATSPFNFAKNVKGTVTLSGIAKTSDGSSADLEYSDTYNGTTTTSPVTVAANGAYSIPLTFAGVDGTHTIQLTASSGGLTASLSRILVVDTTYAAITFLNPVAAAVPTPAVKVISPGNYAIAANGTTDDGVGSGIAKVYAKIGTASTDYATGGAYDFAGTWKECTGTVNWSADVPVNPATEGLKYLFVAAVDAAGNAQIDYVDFVFDVTEPVATFSPTGLPEYTHPATRLPFTLGGFAHDDGLNPGAPFATASSISLSCVKNGTVFDLVPADAGATAVAITTANSADGLWSWHSIAAITDGSNDGLYTFTLTVTDPAGKIKTAEQKILVDTHGPAITVATPTANALYVSSPSNANVIITDSGVGYLDGAVTFTSTDGASNQARNGDSWTVDLALAAEGPKTLTVTATDRLGNAVTSPARTFNYDTQPPSLSLDAVNATYQDRGFKLSGSMSDTNGLKSLTITQQRNGDAIVEIYSYTGTLGAAFDVTSTAAGVTGGSVALPRDPAHPLVLIPDAQKDGKYDYVITLTDKANRQTIVNKTVKIDATPPVLADVMAAGPNVVYGGNTYYSGDVTFSGTALDGNPVLGASGTKIVQYSSSSGAAWIAGSPWNDANGTDYWSITLPLSTADEGQYTYRFQATDNGNLPSVTVDKTIYIDHEPPQATFDAPTLAGGFLDVDLANHIYATDNAFRLSGIADDDLSSHNAGVRAAVSAVLSWRKDGVLVGSQSLAGTGAWSWDSPTVTPLVDGMYVFTLDVTDVANKKTTASLNVCVDTTAPVPTVLAPIAGESYTGTDLVINGKITEAGCGMTVGADVDSVTYVLSNNGVANAAKNTTVAFSGNNGTWTKTIEFGAGKEAAGEGEKTLQVTAKDKRGNTQSLIAPVTFYYDVSSPTLVVNATTDYDLDGSVSFGGTWSESNKLKNIVIAYSKDGGTAVTLETITPTSPDHGDGILWASATHALGDGSYVFTITATDIAGKLAVEPPRTIVIDTHNPTVAINPTPPTTKYFENTLSVSGTAADAFAGTTQSGIEEVRYSIDTQPAAWADWAPVNGTQNWSAEIDISTSATRAADRCGIGSHVLYIRTRDKAQRYVPTNASLAFTVDRENPVITETAYSGTVYKTGIFSISVAIDDDCAFAAASTSGLTATLTSGPSGAVQGSLPNSVNGAKHKEFTYTQSTVPDGTYVITFTAEDSVGRKSTITRTVIVDKTRPTISAVTDLSVGWKTATTQSISGTAGDGTGSGIARVEYRKSSDNGLSWNHGPADDWDILNGTNTFNGSVVLSEGSYNRIEIRAVDKAGNKTDVADTASNTPLVAQSVKVDTEDPDVDIAVVPATATPYNDRVRALNVNVTGTDATSGPIRALASLDKTFALSAPIGSGSLVAGTTYRIISLGTSDFSIVGAGTAPSVGTVFTASGPTSGTGTASAFAQPVLFKNLSGSPDTEQFDVHTLLPPSSGTTKVYFRVEDGAGRYSIPYPQSVVVDVASPKAHITSHKTGDDVNGLITLSGSATDAETGLAETNSVEVYFYKYNVGTSAWEWVAHPSGILTQGTAWKLVDFDTTDISDNPSLYDQNTGNGVDNVQLLVRVVSTDLAGNVSSKAASSTDPENENYYECTLDVTQDSDRPTVKFNNLPLRDTALMSSGHSVWLNGTDTLYGSVTDDDGLSGLTMGVRYKYGAAADFAAGTISVANGTWSCKLPSGDGSYVLEFTVNDAGGKTFTSKAVSTTEDLLGTMKLTDGTDTIGAKGTEPYSFDTFAYFMEDMVAPDVGIGGISVDGGTNWITSGYSSVTLGGAARSMNGTVSSVSKTFLLRGAVSDANGIKSVKLVTSGLDGVASQTLSTIPAAGAYAFTGINCNAGTGTMLITITATDNANLVRTTTLSLAVDNTLPVVTVPSPSSSTTCSGQVTAYGTVSENVKEVSYAISVSGTQSPDDATPLTAWEDAFGTSKLLIGGKSGKSAYDKIKDASFNWYVYFDGDTDPSLTTEHSGILNAHLVDIGVTDQASLDGNSFKDVVKLYLWVKATDVAGNVTETPHLLLLDPQGGRPKVTLSYPEANGVSLGDIVRLNGSATDNGSVRAVFVQLVSNAHNLSGYTPRGGATYGTVVANAGTGTYTVPVPKEGDLDYMASLGFDVYQISTYKSATDNVKWVKGTSTLSVAADGLDWGLLASFGGSSWNYSINRQGELNPTSGSTNPVGIRIIASDSDPTPMTSIALDRVVLFDADLPVIKDVYVVQSGSVDYGAANTASREYTEDMWVSGAWYLTGTATDSNEIRNLKVNNSLVVSNGVAVDGGTAWDIDVSGDKKTVHFKYLLATGSGVGKVSFTMVAEDNTGGVGEQGHLCAPKTVTVNYDNTKPTLTVSGVNYKIDPKVRQSNNFYTLSSEATEPPDGSKNQSGFARTAFYFLRRNPSGTPSYYVFDPMISKGASGNIIDIGSASSPSDVGYAPDDGDIVYQSGLYWKHRTLDARDPMDLSKLTLDGTADDNIHVGGLVEIGNSLYTVKSVAGKVITIDGNPELSYTTANFSISLVVDNTITESSSGAISTAAGYGYGYNNPLNDDGDHMIEGVTKSGTSWTWEANVCSKNIPDGPIEIHYVVFDKAGNFSIGTSGNVIQTAYDDYATKEVADANNACYVFGQYSYGVDTPAFVSNHSPRIAGVVVGSDVNNDGDILDADELNETYKAPATYNVKTLGTSMVLGSTTTPLLTAKGITVIKPEIVGGNGAIRYSYSYQSGNTTASGNNATSLGNGIDNGLSDDSKDTLSDINLQLGDLLKAGKTALTLGNETNMPFTFTLWDSTEGTTQFTNSQRVDITLHMGVQVKDSESPKATITPFHWTSASDNSVFDKKGHIELEDDWALVSTAVKATLPAAISDADPKVSGQIVIKGNVSDNRQLSALYMSVTGMSATNRLNGAYVAINTSLPSNIDASVTVGTETYYLVATCSGGVWKGLAHADTYGTRGFSFVVDPSVYDATGHKTSWTYTWNTEMMSGTADDDVEVRILALDLGIPTCTSSTTPNTTYKYPSVDGTHFYADPTYGTKNNSGNATAQTITATPSGLYKMDVIPYISGVKTALSKLKQTKSSVYDRTSLGDYPVNSAATAYFYGYNLKNGATVADSATTPNTTSLGGADSSSYSGYTVYPAAVSTFTSGYVSITVNNVPSLNNKNLNDAKGSFTGTTASKTGDYDIYLNYYNRQPNDDNNNNLTDDVKLMIWQTTKAAVPQRGSLTYPVMRINPNNDMIGFAFADGSQYFSMSSGIGTSYHDNISNADVATSAASYQLWQNNYADFSNVSFVYDALGNAHAMAVGLDTQPGANPIIGGTLSYMYSPWGPGNISAQGDNSQAYHKLRMESIGIPAGTMVKGSSLAEGQLDIRRFRSPSIATITHTDNTTSVYIAYYDDMQGQIRFRYGTSVPATTGSFNQIRDRVGTVTNYNTDQSIFEANQNYFSLLAGKEGTDTTITPPTNTAGEYLAIDALRDTDLSEDVVVAVWYNGENLMYSYKIRPATDNNAGSGTGTGYWSSAKQIFTNGGEYCAIKVDKVGGVHIAAYDTNNADLKYAFLSKYDVSYNEDTDSCVVDSYALTGTNIMIDTVIENVNGFDVGIPYISYYMPSTQRAKLATLVKPTTGVLAHVVDGVVDDKYSGTWNVTLIPSTIRVQDDRVNVGIWKQASGFVKAAAAIQKTTATTTPGPWYSNGTNNPVIGYAVKDNTSGAIETAQLK